MAMITRVLVPLDGSTNAAAAWPYGKLIAKACGAELEAMWIVEPLMDLAKERTNNYQIIDENAVQQLETMEGKLEGDAKKHLDDLAAEAAKEGSTVTTIVRKGRPAEAIIEAAGSQEGTVICMGTHGRSGIARWMYGSVADRVIHHAQTSTLVIRSKEGQHHPPEAIRRVIVPLDGSVLSENAIAMAVDIAKALGVGITLMRALDLGLEGTIPVTDYGEPPVVDTAEVRAETEAYVAAVADRVRGLGISDVDTRTIDERPAEAIVDEVGEAGDKLVVMGSHGRSGAGRWLLGSVADNVVRHSMGPVLVVRRG